MTFYDFASVMWPSWLMGVFLIYITAKSGNGDLLRIHRRTVIKWVLFLVFVTVYRLLTLRYLLEHSPSIRERLSAVMMIPTPATLTVFWEDACHGLPLVLLSRLVSNKRYAAPVNVAATLFFMAAFGLGHLYQGIPTAIFLSAYIPISVKIGRKRGFGTMMVNHTLYDLFTIITLKCLVG